MKRIIIPLILFIVLSLGTFVWWRSNAAAVNKKDTSAKIFVVQKGQGIREIANNLQKEGFINSSVVFFLIVKQQGLDGKIQAGDFRLSLSMTTQQIAENLTHGTLDIWVTIPEGKRAEEIADLLKEHMPNFDPVWRITLNKNEGYLFPDTYLIPRDATIDTIVSLMRNNFEKKYSELSMANTKLSKNGIVILASIIEREARHDADRPLVASVYMNRLAIDMALQADATVQYTLKYQDNEKSWWKRHLSLADLKVDSPYNTYLYPGLPPTPISNPGFEALKAAANPANTGYLYYITDKTGINRYAKTNTEHNANIRKFGL